MLDLVILKMFFANDSFQFCNEIFEVSSSNKLMILCDIRSLFFSIPEKETNGEAINLISDKNPYLKVTMQELKICLNLQLLEHIFFLMATIMIILTEFRWTLL